MTPPTEGIDNPWAFAAFAVFAFVVALPSFLSWLVAKKNDKKTDRVIKVSTQTNETLTTNNSGSHVKDQLDRVEKTTTRVLEELGSVKNDQQEGFRRLDNLEYVVARLSASEPKRKWWK